jgi:response regulator of citrate/malate metabolism
LLAHPVVQQVLKQPQRMTHPQQQLDQQRQEDMHVQQQQQQQQQTQDCRSHLQQPGQQQPQQPRPARIALVFGREEFGLSDDEVAACDIACAISIGRLQVRLLLKRWRQCALVLRHISMYPLCR